VNVAERDEPGVTADVREIWSRDPRMREKAALRALDAKTYGSVSARTREQMTRRERSRKAGWTERMDASHAGDDRGDACRGQPGGDCAR
jgi:hypothetical protein